MTYSSSAWRASIDPPRRWSVKRTVAPAVTTDSLSFAREQWLKQDDDLEDSIVRRMLLDAAEIAEKFTQRSLLTQTWRLSLDRFSFGDALELPHGPVQSITSVTYYDDAGSPTAWDSSNYWLDDDGDRLVLADGASWPDMRDRRGLEVVYVAGYGGPEDVPADLRDAILSIVAWRYENRGEERAGLPPGVKYAFAPYIRNVLG